MTDYKWLRSVHYQARPVYATSKPHRRTFTWDGRDSAEFTRQVNRQRRRNMERHSANFDEDVDWAQYEPPEALNKLPTITSETILAVVQSSLENIRAQVEVEKQRRVEVEAAIKEEAEAEAAAVAEEEAAKATKGKGKEPENSSPPERLQRAHQLQSVTSLEPPTIQKRSSRFMVSRIWNRVRGGSDYKGEASTSSIPLTNRISLSPSDNDNEPPGPTPFTQFVYKHLRPSAESIGETVECVCCLDDINPKDGIKTVCHYYCKDCFVRLIETALENEAQWPPKCCLNPIPFRTIKKRIPADLLKSYRAKDEEFTTPVEQRLYCSQPDCGAWIRKEFQDRAARTATCPSGHVICFMCRGATHPADEACPQDRDQQMTDRLAEEEGWLRCTKCAVLVEHREACQHMTCRCGNEFCYVCGLRWRTCSCTMEQLDEIKARAAKRREERTAEEDAEAKEITEALRLVAQLEAEEERKNEIRREELRKQREKRRRKEAAERARREEARRAALDIKYRELSSTLNKLNDLQRMVLTYTHDREMETTATRAAQARAQLSQKQDLEKRELRAATTAKLADKMKDRERDYAVRVLWEEQVEQDYDALLTIFWGDILDGHAKAREALRSYIRKNDARLEAWQRGRDREFEKVRYLLDDEVIIQGELQGAAKQRLEDRLAAEGIETGRKHRAEGKWFELVVAERARLLAEVEMVERENGGEGSSGAGSSKEDEVLEFRYKDREYSMKVVI